MSEKSFFDELADLELEAGGALATSDPEIKKRDKEQATTKKPAKKSRSKV